MSYEEFLERLRLRSEIMAEPKIHIELTKKTIEKLHNLKGWGESYDDVIMRALILSKMDTLRDDLTKPRPETGVKMVEKPQSKKKDVQTQKQIEEEIEETKKLREGIEEVEGDSE